MTVRYDIARSLGQQLVESRRARGLTQRRLAERVRITPARIAEMEADLLNGRSLRDRLTLLIALCDVLDVVPVLVPRSRVQDVNALLGRGTADAPAGAGNARSVFDEVYVDLGDDEEDE